MKDKTKEMIRRIIMKNKGKHIYSYELKAVVRENCNNGFSFTGRQLDRYLSYLCKKNKIQILEKNPFPVYLL